MDLNEGCILQLLPKFLGNYNAVTYMLVQIN